MRFRVSNQCGSALLLVMWATLVLAGALFAWVTVIQQDVTRMGQDNLGLEARALAYSGVSVALHPGVTANTPILNREFESMRRYEVQLTGEGGKLNINWLLQGEDAGKIEILQQFLQSRGVKFADRQMITDCLLDWIDPDNERHMNGKEQTDNYQPANRPFQSVDEMELVHGMDLLGPSGSWKPYFTVHSQGPIDIKAASYDTLRIIPGIGDAQAQRFIQFRDGKDRKNGTVDDFVFQRGLPEAASYLGLVGDRAKQVLPFLLYNDPTYEIVSTGYAGKVNRQIKVVARKDSPSPTILLWNEL